MASRLRSVSSHRRFVVALIAAITATGAASALAEPAAAFVYWANQSGPSGGTGTTIGRANLDGSNPNQSFISGADGPMGPAVDATHVFWGNSNGTTIGRAELSGANVEQSFISGASNPTGIAVDASHVFWTNGGSDTIGRADLDGTDADQSFITGASGPCGVAVNATHIFWANAFSNTIGRADIDGGNVDQDLIPFTLAGPSGPCGVAVNAAHIFYAHGGGAAHPAGTSRIGRADIDGTNAIHDFITLSGVTTCGVAVNATHVFWADRQGRIGRANLNGTNPDPNFITGAFNPCGVAVNADVAPLPPSEPGPEPGPEAGPQPKADGTLTIDANKGKVEKGRKVTLTGQLDVPTNEGCEPNRAIQIQRRLKSEDDSKFQTFQTVETDATGNYSLRVKVKTTYLYRAVVSETEACDDEISNSQKVRVQKKKAAQEA